MKKWTLTRKAQADVQNIWNWIAQSWITRADRYVDMLAAKMTMLANNPFLGADCSHRRPGLRFLRAKSHVIYYHAVPQGIEVVRILHGAQDADAELD
jgi:toxin ParE1/3/4